MGGGPCFGYAVSDCPPAFGRWLSEAVRWGAKGNDASPEEDRYEEKGRA
jgi:hypothetical protein